LSRRTLFVLPFAILFSRMFKQQDSQPSQEAK